MKLLALALVAEVINPVKLVTFTGVAVVANAPILTVAVLKEDGILESTYPFVAASVLSVGVARFVIFYEFKDNEEVGAVIEFKTVVDR